MPRQLKRGFYLILGKPCFRSAQSYWELVNLFWSRIKLNFALKVITNVQIGDTVIKKLFLQFETYLKGTFRLATSPSVRPSLLPKNLYVYAFFQNIATILVSILLS